MVKLSDLRGKVVVLTFIYTRCPLPDFCPLMDRKFADLAQKINTFPARAQHIRLISLSFDPEHDQPDVLRKHAAIRGAVPPLWTFAVASHDELAKIAAPLGLFYEPGTNEIAHNLSTAVIDPHGKLARLDVGTQRNRWETTDLLKSIYSLLPDVEQVKRRWPFPDESIFSHLAVTFISAHLCKSKLAHGWPRRRVAPANRLDRTNVTNQSAKSLQIKVDSREKSYMMSTTTHVVIRSRKIVIASLSDWYRSRVD